MKKVYAFLADGFEEIECLAVVDLLRRAEINILTVSIMDSLTVTGAHDIKVTADKLFSEISCEDADMLFLPGGGGGTQRLRAHDALLKELAAFAKLPGKRIAAICAAPSVLGALGLLAGRDAVCFPGFEKFCTGANIVNRGVVTDGMITTAKGMGVSIKLGLEIISLLINPETACAIKNQIQYEP